MPDASSRRRSFDSAVNDRSSPAHRLSWNGECRGGHFARSAEQGESRRSGGAGRAGQLRDDHDGARSRVVQLAAKFWF
jgi:hypothetical protein